MTEDGTPEQPPKCRCGLTSTKRWLILTSFWYCEECKEEVKEGDYSESPFTKDYPYDWEDDGGYFDPF